MLQCHTTALSLPKQNSVRCLPSSERTSTTPFLAYYPPLLVACPVYDVLCG